MQPLDLDALGDEITILCGHLDAAEYRLLELIRQFDAVAPWGLWELKSCAHWLNWKCGIALGAAREKVRVAHAEIQYRSAPTNLQGGNDRLLHPI